MRTPEETHDGHGPHAAQLRRRRPEIGYHPGPLGRLGVLLDAFLVRLVLLPVMLRLTERAAWWAPRWLTRILPSIHFAHD